MNSKSPCPYNNHAYQVNEEPRLNDTGSVSMEAVMDTITRVYLGITVMSLAAQIAFPFYSHLKTNEENINKSIKKFTTTYLSDICFNESSGGDPEYGTCPKPIKSLT